MLKIQYKVLTDEDKSLPGKAELLLLVILHGEKKRKKKQLENGILCLKIFQFKEDSKRFTFELVENKIIKKVYVIGQQCRDTKILLFF